MSGNRQPPSGNEAARRAQFIVGDPVRGLAAFGVFSFHVALAALFVTGFDFNRSSFNAFGAIPGEILNNARLAVYTFFALSGYLIGRPFVHAYLRDEPGPQVSVYFRRRVLRIMPAFVLVVTAALLRFGTIDASATDLFGVYSLVYVYDLTQGTLQQGVFGHLWTVQAEMGFYLLLPVAMVGLGAMVSPRLGSRGRFLLLLALLLGVAVASLAFRHVAPHTVGYARWLPSVLFAFTPGVALAAVEAFIPSFAASRPRLSRVGVSALVAAGILCCLAFAVLDGRSPAVLGAIAAFGTAALIGGALLKQWSGGGAWRILDNKPLHWFGQRSYSFYLVHVPVVWDLQFRFQGQFESPKLAFVVLFAAAFSLSAGLATLGFHYVERPFMAMRRWPWQRTASVTPAAQPGAPPTSEPALAPRA